MDPTLLPELTRVLQAIAAELTTQNDRFQHELDRLQTAIAAAAAQDAQLRVELDRLTAAVAETHVHLARLADELEQLRQEGGLPRRRPGTDGDPRRVM